MGRPRRFRTVTTVTVAFVVAAGSAAAAVALASGAAPQASHGRSRSTGATGTSGTSGVTTWAGTPVTAKAIPLGDGKVSSTPEVGYEDSCTTAFSTRGGAVTAVPWIDTSTGTWNMVEKLRVEGHNTWPTASHSFTLEGSSRVLQTDDLPVDATTGDVGGHVRVYRQSSSEIPELPVLSAFAPAHSARR